ncbi:MAG TPA: hypothetical protein VEV41_02935 [Terriglobales bacterium]|nr:hypothetical protein [Terriglobales bacterium]
MTRTKEVLQTGTTIGHPFTCLNDFAGQVQPPTVPYQRAFWTLLEKVALFLWVYTKPIENLAKLFGIDEVALCYEVSTKATTTALRGPSFHPGVCRSRPLAVVADYLIA